jgi:acyl-[acyl carrier protein]--UDP-N-acetylglucosamine O-acyltransferase
LASLIHATAEVAENAKIGEDTKIWHHCQVRPNAVIGENCNIGKGVYIDADVHVGDNVKIQNYVSVYHGVTLEDGVFIGPHACFTNDMRPRAINADGSPKSVMFQIMDWYLAIPLACMDLSAHAGRSWKNQENKKMLSWQSVPCAVIRQT